LTTDRHDVTHKSLSSKPIYPQIPYLAGAVDDSCMLTMLKMQNFHRHPLLAIVPPSAAAHIIPTRLVRRMSGSSNSLSSSSRTTDEHREKSLTLRSAFSSPLHSSRPLLSFPPILFPPASFAEGNNSVGLRSGSGNEQTGKFQSICFRSQQY
jgi:hypothetical protein